MNTNSPRAQTPSYVISILALCGGTFAFLCLVVLIFANVFLNSKAVLVHRAASLQAMKRYGDAEPLLVAAVKQSPRDAEVANNLAWTYYLDGKYSEGEPHALHSVTLARRYYNLDTLAHIELGLKHYDAAVRDFKAALTLQPNNTYSLDGLGQAYEGRGQPDKALAEYRKAMQNGPGVEGTRERMTSVERRLKLH